MLTPRQIIAKLDQNVVGQHEAKKAVAIALRNRWRRQQVEPSLRAEIMPKNILMIGPTGVGKSEIARRLATLADAPFIKVEATKFTEVGYVGRDVESIIRDLIAQTITSLREREINRHRPAVAERAERRIIDALLEAREGSTDVTSARTQLLQQLREGLLNEERVTLDLALETPEVEIMAPPGMEEMTQQIQGMMQQFGGRKRYRKRSLLVPEALELLVRETASASINDEDLRARALAEVEQNGIVFLDEIDKVVGGSHGQGEVSREGVQRDLLPLIEGCTVATRYGSLSTYHILFIASGAFHLNKPSDLVPELQGRLPIRVELQAFGEQDFYRILQEPDSSLLRQYQALLATEGRTLHFSPAALRETARIASILNDQTENIGARRLHTVMEKLLEDLLFETDGKDSTIRIDRGYVRRRLGHLVEDIDLSHYIL